MKKIWLAASIIIFALSACGSSDSESGGEAEPQMHIEDLDKDKAKEAIVAEAVNMNSQGEEYQAEDIVNIEVCEALQIDHKNDGFTGKFISFWETSDGDHQQHFLLNDQYEVERIANYDRIEDRCVQID
ncbi:MULTISPECIES: hypothetical protein [Gracilibacillus]|uniref:hypothetical protein n=1 Tax=Gracilibacillus TaxID=74385 RepID=UPI000824D6A9|nr:MULTISPECIES: hypothetical protein [Gracilibacillus]